MKYVDLDLSSTQNLRQKDRNLQRNADETTQYDSHATEEQYAYIINSRNRFSQNDHDAYLGSYGNTLVNSSNCVSRSVAVTDCLVPQSSYSSLDFDKMDALRKVADEQKPVFALSSFHW